MAQQHYKEIQNEQSLLSKHSKQSSRSIGFGLFGPKNCFLVKSYNDLFEPIRDMEVRENDIWVVSFGKTGTTWLQELVWLVANDWDFQGAKIDIDERFPWLEKPIGIPGQTKSAFQIVNQMPQSARRFIKTHLPLNLLPTQIQSGIKTPKILYIIRNPMDTVVSTFYHMKGTTGYFGTLDDVVGDFVNDCVTYGPFWTHVQEFWEQKEKTNFLFLTFESMKSDLKNVILQVCEFLNKPPPSPEIMEKLLLHLNFESMKANPAVNKDGIRSMMANKLHIQKQDFMRKGRVGGWKEEMSEESVAKMKVWVEKNWIPGIWEWDEMFKNL